MAVLTKLPLALKGLTNTTLDSISLTWETLLTGRVVVDAARGITIGTSERILPQPTFCVGGCMLF